MTAPSEPDAEAASPHDAPQPPELADEIVAAVTAVPGVARMHAGMFGEVATHLPGRRVLGVQVRDDVVVVHVAVFWGADVLGTADNVRAVTGMLALRPVDVVVEDVMEAPGTSWSTRP